MRTLLIAALLAVATPVVAVVGGGDVKFKVNRASDAVFSHEAHVVKAKLGCRDCHSKLYLDTTRTKHTTMKQMAQGKSCGACHDGKRAAGLDDCGTCHR
ncbi:MAG TPA: cytochrome c3 family protein [Anaeromyxobacteraceae bacterium]